MVLGLLVSAPAALLEGPLPWPAPASLGALAWYAWVPTAAGFLLWYAGSSRVSGGEAATFTAVAPLTAVALAAGLLGEPLGLSQGLGIGAVVLAILVLAAPLRDTASR